MYLDEYLWSMRWRIVFGAIVLFALHWFTHGAKAQERQFTLTIPESHLQAIGKAMGRQPYEDARPIIEGIQAQVSAQFAREAQAAHKAERERIKAELTKEDKQP